MRVMVFVKATEDSEKGFVHTPETAAMLEAMGKFNDELSKAGILRAGDGLKPSSKGKRVALTAPTAWSLTGPLPKPRNWSPASGCGKSRIWMRPSPG